MARITRKELKTDRFAQEVGHTLDFFDRHRREIYRIGAGVLAVVLIAVGIVYYQRHQNAARERVLGEAFLAIEAPAGEQAAAMAPGGLSFPTEEAREVEAVKRFGDVASRYPGTRQGLVAEYTLASLAADQGRMLEAEKRFKTVADSGDKDYAPLARMSLAEIHLANGRTEEAERLFRAVIDSPSVFVSKDEATIALARAISDSKPEEARKLLDPLRASRVSAVSQAAIQAYGELPQQ